VRCSPCEASTSANAWMPHSYQLVLHVCEERDKTHLGHIPFAAKLAPHHLAHARLGGRLLPCKEHGRSGDAQAQIGAAGGLAERGRGGAEVQHVVHQLRSGRVSHGNGRMSAKLGSKAARESCMRSGNPPRIPLVGALLTWNAMPKFLPNAYAASLVCSFLRSTTSPSSAFPQPPRITAARADLAMSAAVLRYVLCR
jgi:hypothetical protein